MDNTPEYTIDRPLSLSERSRRRYAYGLMEKFISENEIESFDMRETYAGNSGMFIIRTPSFDWSVEGRTASISYEYDKKVCA